MPASAPSCSPVAIFETWIARIVCSLAAKVEQSAVLPIPPSAIAAGLSHALRSSSLRSDPVNSVVLDRFRRI